MDSFLRKRTFEGVARRYGAKASMKLRARADKQVNTELALIAKLGLPATSSSCEISSSSAASTASWCTAGAPPSTPPSATRSASAGR